VGEALHDRVRTAFFLEKSKHQLHCPADFIVRIQHDATFVIVGKAHGQRGSQLTLACLVQLAAQEAPAQEMQLGLGHRALQTEQQSVVEIGRVVAAVRVDHQGVRQRAQLQQSMPVEVGTCQSRHFQRKHGSDLTHRDVRHQGLEVLAARTLCTRHPLIPVQHLNRPR
jgi:hypothetical protein